MKGRLLLFVFGLIFISTTAFAQRSISGKVTNPDGAGIGGVSIQEKGKSNQAFTTAYGNFTIIGDRGATLVFRSIGLVTLERTIGTESTLNVIMRDDESSIDEVIVTAH